MLAIVHHQSCRQYSFKEKCFKVDEQAGRPGPAMSCMASKQPTMVDGGNHHGPLCTFGGSEQNYTANGSEIRMVNLLDVCHHMLHKKIMGLGPVRLQSVQLIPRGQARTACDDMTRSLQWPWGRGLLGGRMVGWFVVFVSLILGKHSNIAGNRWK